MNPSDRPTDNNQVPSDLGGHSHTERTQPMSTTAPQEADTPVMGCISKAEYWRILKQLTMYRLGLGEYDDSTIEYEYPEC